MARHLRAVPAKPETPAGKTCEVCAEPSAMQFFGHWLDVQHGVELARALDDREEEGDEPSRAFVDAWIQQRRRR